MRSEAGNMQAEILPHISTILHKLYKHSMHHVAEVWASLSALLFGTLHKSPKSCSVTACFKQTVGHFSSAHIYREFSHTATCMYYVGGSENTCELKLRPRKKQLMHSFSVCA